MYMYASAMHFESETEELRIPLVVIVVACNVAVVVGVIAVVELAAENFDGVLLGVARGSPSEVAGEFVALLLFDDISVVGLLIRTVFFGGGPPLAEAAFVLIDDVEGEEVVDFEVLDIVAEGFVAPL
jgi:hypothetical protein